MTNNVRKLRTVSRAVEAGDRRGEILAMRDRLWTALTDPTTAARDLSPLVLRLLELGQALEELDNVDDGTNVVADTPDEAWNGEGY